MITLRRPTPQSLDRLRREQSALGPSCPDVGAIARGDCPRGYAPLTHRAVVGQGPADLARGAAGLDRWAMIPPWVQVRGPTAVGSTVTVVSHQLGLWTRNACRVISREAGPRHAALTYATLPAHVERGEERFALSLGEDEQLYFEVTSVSRPAHPLVWLTYPIARRLQWRFARDSAAVMRRWVQSRRPPKGVGA